MFQNSNFAAFIITYNRPKILINTISIILNQSFPPEEVHIIDNSDNEDTEKALKTIKDQRIVYYKVGFNSGPAGGSKIGLEILAKSFEWIYWGDDNNPPRDEKVFEEIFYCIDNLQKRNEKIGLIGGKGAYINKFTGRIRSLSNYQLKKANILEVDFIPGGQTLIVNSKVVNEGILPNEKLFFSFEDLDFSLKVKRADYKIFIDASTWYEVRQSYNDTADNYRPKGNSFGNTKSSWARQYYSSRNLLNIYYYQKLYFPFFFQFMKTIIKIPTGFIYGIRYGLQNAKIHLSALKSFLINDFNNTYKIQ